MTVDKGQSPSGELAKFRTVRPMEAIAERRAQIRDFVQNSKACRAYFHAAKHDKKYTDYFVCMYLLQDTTESLFLHRERGFRGDPWQSYLEIWGVFQALTIQQDAIAEIWRIVMDAPFSAKLPELKAWRELRELRNECAGHPARKDRPAKTPKVCTFMGRSFGDYDRLTFERWEDGAGSSHPVVNLGALIDSYEIEAEAILAEILEAMRNRWRE